MKANTVARCGDNWYLAVHIVQYSWMLVRSIEHQSSSSTVKSIFVCVLCKMLAFGQISNRSAHMTSLFSMIQLRHCRESPS